MKYHHQLEKEIAKQLAGLLGLLPGLAGTAPQGHRHSLCYGSHYRPNIDPHLAYSDQILTNPFHVTVRRNAFVIIYPYPLFLDSSMMLRSGLLSVKSEWR